MTKSSSKTPRAALGKRLSEIGSLEDCVFFLRKKKVRISGSYLSMLIRGIRDPSVVMAKKLSKALEIPLQAVIGE